MSTGTPASCNAKPYATECRTSSTGSFIGWINSVGGAFRLIVTHDARCNSASRVRLSQRRHGYTRIAKFGIDDARSFHLRDSDARTFIGCPLSARTTTPDDKGQGA